VSDPRDSKEYSRAVDLDLGEDQQWTIVIGMMGKSSLPPSSQFFLME
jgi:hypothetical protein